MSSTSKKSKALPAQGVRTSRARREGGIVSAPLPSSSSEGHPPACTAGAGAVHATARYKVLRVDNDLGCWVTYEVISPWDPSNPRQECDPWDSCPPAVKGMVDRMGATPILEPPEERVVVNRGPERGGSPREVPPPPPPSDGPPHNVLGQGEKGFPLLPPSKVPERSALAFETELASLRQEVRLLRAEVARERSERERAVSLAESGRERAERREFLVRQVMDELLRAWGITPPEDVHDLLEVLPLPPPGGVDRGTMTTEEVVPKVEEEVAPATSPRVSAAPVCAGAAEGATEEWEGGDLLQRMEEVLEARLVSFWERISQILPVGSRERSQGARDRGGADPPPIPTSGGPEIRPGALRTGVLAEAGWEEARGRRARRAGATSGCPLGGGPSALSGGVRAERRGKGGGVAAAPIPKPPRRKVGVPGMGRMPSRAAVALHVPGASAATYAEVLREAVKVSPEGGAVSGVRPRPSASGGVILEVPGGAAVADRLADSLAAHFGDRVRVARPQKYGEIRVRGLVTSVTREDLVSSLATGGGCRREAVQVGTLRFTPAGTGTVWARLPLVAARRIAREGSVRMGWVALPVEALAARPMQCYRCLEFGHSRQRCTGEARPPCCFRCGDPLHLARGCVAPPRCLLCEAQGWPASHRMGGRACPCPSAKRGGRGGKGTAPSEGGLPRGLAPPSSLSQVSVETGGAPDPPPVVALPTPGGEEPMEVEVGPLPKRKGAEADPAKTGGVGTASGGAPPPPKRRDGGGQRKGGRPGLRSSKPKGGGGGVPAVRGVGSSELDKGPSESPR